MAERAPTDATAFFDQLSESPYVLDLRPPESVRPPSSAGPAPPTGLAGSARPTGSARSAAGRGDRPAGPAVLLISRVRDGEFDAVASLLGRAGVRTARLNADEDIDLVVDPVRRVARVHGHWLTPTVTWLRHFSAQAIAGHDDRAQDLFLRESWSAAVGQLAGISSAIRSQREGVLAQLRLAERHGIAVPRTILTTDPYEAKELLHSPRLVIKAAHRHFVESTPGSLTGVFPAVVGHTDLTPLPRPGPPVIVQEYVGHSAEFRVYYVAGRAHGFEIVKDAPGDLWLRGDQVRIRAADLPPTVIRAARRLAAARCLRYCAFDFLLRNGRPVFLEMDPAGDWRWIESKAGVTTVTMAVARMLCDLHRANAPGGAKSFDLLAFLRS